MENIQHPFPLPIYKKIINKSLFFKIKQEAYDFIKENKNLFQTQKTWNCNTLSTIHINDKDNFKSSTLEDEIKNSVSEYLSTWNYIKKPKLNLSNTWINLAPPNTYQEVHHHHPHNFSGTLYINFPKNGGNLCFHNPMTSECFLMGDFQQLLSPQKILIPQNGLIVLFPSWLEHSVILNKSNQNRISISFNIDQL